jgi:broad-specificity NMP kinase
MNIIAFTGKRGHGKSTAAEVLVREHGYVHLNFADPLREVCHLVYGVSYEEMLDPVLKEKVLERWPFKAPRELLQQIGTDMFRNYIPETWVESGR